MPKTLAWLGGSTVATVAATCTHGPLLVVLIIFAAVVVAALVTTYVAAVFRPRRRTVNYRAGRPHQGRCASLRDEPAAYP